MTVTGRPAAVITTAERLYVLLQVPQGLTVGVAHADAVDERVLNTTLRVALDVPRPPLWRRVRALVIGR